jgi:hypothetical protein
MPAEMTIVLKLFSLTEKLRFLEFWQEVQIEEALVANIRADALRRCECSASALTHNLIMLERGTEGFQ